MYVLFWDQKTVVRCTSWGDVHEDSDSLIHEKSFFTRTARWTIDSRWRPCKIFTERYFSSLVEAWNEHDSDDEMYLDSIRLLRAVCDVPIVCRANVLVCTCTTIGAFQGATGTTR